MVISLTLTTTYFTFPWKVFLKQYHYICVLTGGAGKKTHLWASFWLAQIWSHRYCQDSSLVLSNFCNICSSEEFTTFLPKKALILLSNIAICEVRSCLYGLIRRRLKEEVCQNTFCLLKGEKSGRGQRPLQEHSRSSMRTTDRNSCSEGKGKWNGL